MSNAWNWTVRLGEIAVVATLVAAAVAVAISTVGMVAASRMDADTRADIRCFLGVADPSTPEGQACLSAKLEEQSALHAERMREADSRLALAEGELARLGDAEERARRAERLAAERINELEGLEDELEAFNTFDVQNDGILGLGGSVTTGIRWTSLLNQQIEEQWCYILRTNSAGVEVRVFLGDSDGSGRPDWRPPHDASLQEIGLSPADFERLKGLCQFRREG